MKTKSHIIQIVLIATGALIANTACSSLPGQSASGRDISANGPTVMNAHAEPSTVELNRNLQPIQDAEVIADVKDFRSKITNVHLKFVNVPIQVPMQNIGGTTWRAQLTPQQLRMLAVSGKTIKYEADVIAKNEAGQIASSTSPVTIGVKSPERAQTAG